LVVEDDPGTREMYRYALHEEGYVVVTVGDGLAALHYLEQRLPSAIVLDLALPRMNGRDVVRELEAHSETRAIPIIVVTGTDASDLDEKRFADVLMKPVASEDLIRAIERSIGQSTPR
jgi:CheY-like chemotaxis protein